MKEELKNSPRSLKCRLWLNKSRMGPAVLSFYQAPGDAKPLVHTQVYWSHILSGKDKEVQSADCSTGLQPKGRGALSPRETSMGKGFASPANLSMQ